MKTLNIIDGPCNIDCPRYCSGTCPFDPEEQELECPRWKEINQKMGYIIRAINTLQVHCYDIKDEHKCIKNFSIYYETNTLIITVEIGKGVVQTKFNIEDIISADMDEESKEESIILLGMQLIEIYTKMILFKIRKNTNTND